jgi:hypothetical protein
MFMHRRRQDRYPLLVDMPVIVRHQDRVSKAKQDLDLAELRGQSTAVSSASRGQKQAGKPVMDSNLRLNADDTDGYIDLI